MRESRLIRFLEWLELKMYAAARRIVTVGEGYRRQLVAKGVPEERIEIIPNGVDLSFFQPRDDDGALRKELGLGKRFVCAYVGTIGMGSGLSVILRAARLLKEAGRDDVRLLLVGDGAVREELEEEARAEGLEAVVFTGRLPKARMPEVLAAADACFVHLRRSDLFQTVMPSKIFEAAAMRCPIVLGVGGFAAELVGTAEAGICIEPENERELIAAVDELAADPGRAERMGAAGAERIATRHDYVNLAARYAEYLAKVPLSGVEQ
jgi:glycosyltransferase involved in cell wall biosynthesis